MTKQDKIKAYNSKNDGYNITNIKKMTQEQIENYRVYGDKSLYELYADPSQLKIDSYNEILATYKPEIIGVQGSCFSYSVLLKADNGDILHITKDNNYLVEVK